MNKAQLIEQVAAKAGWTKKDTAKLVNLVLDEIIDCFHKGESVKISGFGNFVVKQKAERIGKNPINKEEITVPAFLYTKRDMNIKFQCLHIRTFP